MGFQDDKFGHTAYKYEPGEEQLVERNPDKLVSTSGMHAEDRGDSAIWALMIRGLGVVVLRGTGKDCHGVSIFTKDDLLFESDVILGRLE